jgi:hypothetical protein
MSDKAVSDLAAATVETPRDTRPILDQAAQILAEAAAPPRDQPVETPESADPPVETWDLKSVAERLGTDPAKLYESLKVSIADGEELTVSALKDAYRPAAELEKARGKLLEEMETSKREVVQTQQEFAALLQLLGPQNLNQELLAEVNRRTEKQKAFEAERLLKAVPEWKDPIARAADWVDIRKAGQAVGYTDAEMRLAEAGYADHRLIALLRQVAKGPKVEQPKPPAKVAVKPVGNGKPNEAAQFGQLKAQVKKGQLRPEMAGAMLIQGKY